MPPTSPELAPGVRAGDVLAGKYEVLSLLGAGGMGVVVAARHAQLGARVAIKFLLPAMLQNSEAVARFTRESGAAVRIISEHVPRVHDVGTLENGAPYIVMEFLEGEDLASWLEHRGPLSVVQAVEFILQACVGIADAHAVGIVHRDLKPSNLFCLRRSDGELLIKVLDFGISKMTDRAQPTATQRPSVTRTGVAMGSPAYSSPEQFKSARDVDARTDIWALGVILYELLSGITPFPGETVSELARSVAWQAAPSLANRRPDLPRGLEEVVVTCLSKNPDDRYPNVAELAGALLPFGTARAQDLARRVSGILQTAGLTSVERSPGQAHKSAKSYAKFVRAIRLRSTRMQIIAAVLVVGVAATIVLSLRMAASLVPVRTVTVPASTSAPELPHEGSPLPSTPGGLSSASGPADVESFPRNAPVTSSATGVGADAIGPSPRPASASPPRPVASRAERGGTGPVPSPSSAASADPFDSWEFKR